MLRQLITGALDVRRIVAVSVGIGCCPRGLLTDDGGRPLHVTEFGRYASERLARAIMVRAGTCRYPTCSVPADRCHVDHHEPVPHGPTSAANLDPVVPTASSGEDSRLVGQCPRPRRVDETLPDAERYRGVDDPLPTGLAAWLCLPCSSRGEEAIGLGIRLRPPAGRLLKPKDHS